MYGVRSDTVLSGEKALKLLESRLKSKFAADSFLSPFKLILCDYNMQGMSGPETAREMHRMLDQFKEDNPDITLQIPYICCLTAYSGREQRD